MGEQQTPKKIHVKVLKWIRLTKFWISKYSCEKMCLFLCSACAVCVTLRFKLHDFMQTKCKLIFMNNWYFNVKSRHNIWTTLHSKSMLKPAKQTTEKKASEQWIAQQCVLVCVRGMFYFCSLFKPMHKFNCSFIRQTFVNFILHSANEKRENYNKER